MWYFALCISISQTTNKWLNWLFHFDNNKKYRCSFRPLDDVSAFCLPWINEVSGFFLFWLPTFRFVPYTYKGFELKRVLFQSLPREHFMDTVLNCGMCACIYLNTFHSRIKMRHATSSKGNTQVLTKKIRQCGHGLNGVYGDKKHVDIK